eukprot:scaffold9305_cov29-Tisochrysis_lutea.AAC.1
MLGHLVLAGQGVYFPAHVRHDHAPHACIAGPNKYNAECGRLTHALTHMLNHPACRVHCIPRFPGTISDKGKGTFTIFIPLRLLAIHGMLAQCRRHIVQRPAIHQESRRAPHLVQPSQLHILSLQLKTHTHIFESTPPTREASRHSHAETASLKEHESLRVSTVSRGASLGSQFGVAWAAEESAAEQGGSMNGFGGAVENLAKEDEDDEDDEEDVLGLRGSVVWLAGITLVISLLSHYIVDTIEGASEALKIPVPYLTPASTTFERLSPSYHALLVILSANLPHGISSFATQVAFVSTILLPIVGNAAEHAAAVLFAMKNKTDLAIGVAIGSSTQITLLAIPFCVVCAWVVGAPLSLDFAPFETGVFVFSILGASAVVSDGRSHWLKGVVLVAAYAVLAAAFWFHVDPPNISGITRRHHSSGRRSGS